jgi:F-type H+-transporting ATPase subunit epsilon
MALTLEIVTPEARVYSDTVDTVVIPTLTGEIGILPGHIPLLTQVVSGELRLMKEGKEHILVVGKGFAQIEADKVSILAEHAITEEKIDEQAVEQALKRAQTELTASAHLDPAEQELLHELVRFAGIQLELKRRKH